MRHQSSGAWLPNEELASLEQCCERIDWYRRRWIVEIFFRILKSGCRVEALQLGTRERLERALALYLIPVVSKGPGASSRWSRSGGSAQSFPAK